MLRYWVVSANVNGRRSTLQPWIRMILLNESAYMGWSNEDRTGKVFATIAPNDAVLIAYGPMTNHGAARRLVACGRVKDNRANDDPRGADLRHSQFAQLHSFVPLNEDPTKNGISLKGHRSTGVISHRLSSNCDATTRNIRAIRLSVTGSTRN
jgi:hypothetical protein